MKHTLKTLFITALFCVCAPVLAWSNKFVALADVQFSVNDSQTLDAAAVGKLIGLLHKTRPATLEVIIAIGCADGTR
jgi:hypothetical protein